ncbi:MAG: AbrB family transcriptional regulator, partial [Neobacillus sp.]
SLLNDTSYLLFSMIGGLILSFSGIPIAWMMGSLLFAGLLSSLPPKWITVQMKINGIHPYWRQIGQTLLGIELGRNFSGSIIDTFEDYFLIIIVMVISSITIAFLSGILLWRFSKVNMITSLLGTTPGGISAMPSIAEEVGANAFIVNIIQTLRILLVIGVIPFVAGAFNSATGGNALENHPMPLAHQSLRFTELLIIGALSGALVSKRFKMPVPWLVGSMLGAAIVQLLFPLLFGQTDTAFWPHEFIFLAQILIGTSIGSRINKNMFKGLGRIIGVGLVSSLCLVISMLLFSFLIADITHIPLVTCILAFAPGGVAEMATAAIALHADSTFVVAVQSLRLITIITLLPPLFRFINNHEPIHSIQFRK